ncbi:hypothetical protein [Winogradskyella poriferorum]|uniref:hypothetical protein n=1 Tax=Winogradskyella poriferorum TaxID=307627 RepID=UPI003D645CF5
MSENIDLTEFLVSKIDEVKQLEYSKNNAQKVIDICLDIRNEVIKKEDIPDKTRFIKFDLRLSTDPFVFILNDEDQPEDDIDKYWNDHIGELLFDLKGLLRGLRR